nr:cyclic nucleotide-binding domain-containing protein [Thiorhodovibrio winogradskyi]
MLSADGDERVLEILRPPRTFGEAAAFLGQPCALHVEALSDARLLFIDVRQVRATILRTGPKSPS